MLTGRERQYNETSTANGHLENKFNAKKLSNQLQNSQVGMQLVGEVLGQVSDQLNKAGVWGFDETSVVGNVGRDLIEAGGTAAVAAAVVSGSIEIYHIIEGDEANSTSTATVAPPQGNNASNGQVNSSAGQGNSNNKLDFTPVTPGEIESDKGFTHPPLNEFGNADKGFTPASIDEINSALNGGYTPPSPDEIGNINGGFTPTAPTGVGNDGGFTLPPIDLNDYIQASEDNSSSRPPNLSPDGAGRNGAFRAAKRHAGIPVSQQPDSVGPNINNQGKVVNGKDYIFQSPENNNMPLDENGRLHIRDDADGHIYNDDPTQNRGPHFNTSDKGHFDYGK